VEIARKQFVRFVQFFPKFKQRKQK